MRKENTKWVGGRLFRHADVIPQLLNVIARRRLEFEFEYVPYESRGMSLKRMTNLFLHGLNQYLSPSKPLGVPVIAQVEPVNTCDLACPLCLTTPVTPSRPKKLMKFETFKRFIDDVGDYLLLIVLWGWGEPFLNPDIFRMVEYAKARDILVHCSTHASLKNFNQGKAERLVDSGLDTLIVAVDGATQESYSKYRVGGDLELILKNIRTIVAAKKVKGLATPRLVLRFIVMGHNEHELPRIREIAEELEVDFLGLRGMFPSPVLDQESSRTFLPADLDYRSYGKSTCGGGGPNGFRCMRPWKRVTLLAGGEIVSCEFDHKIAHSFGTLNDETSTLSLWRGETAKAFRADFNQGENDYYLCQACSYKGMELEECTVELQALGACTVGRGDRG